MREPAQPSDVERDSRVVLLASADEQYGMPMAVMLRSALDNLAADHTLLAYLIDGGMTPSTRAEVGAALAGDGRATVEWLSVPPDPRVGETFCGRPDVTCLPAFLAYLRLGELLPPGVPRILVLDCDLLVRGDLAALWHQDLRGTIVGAVPIRPNLATMLGFEPEEVAPCGDQRAFNGGVILVDVDAWRAARIGEVAQELLVRYQGRFPHIDQDALNCALVGRWLPLPLTWNFRPPPFGFRPWSPGPYAPGEWEEASRSPRIVHFAGLEKPWRYGCELAFVDEFFGYLDRTSWAGLRPVKPSLAGRTWRANVTRPHSRLDRLVEMRVKARRASVNDDRYFLFQAAREVAARPWLTVTYPVDHRRKRARGRYGY